MGITFKMPSLASPDEGASIRDRKWIQAVVFGPSGMGKTPFAAQFPRALFLMADRNGENSLLRTQTPYVPIRSVEDFDAALDEIRKEQFNENRQFDTIVLDTISVFQDHIVVNMLERLGLKNMEGFKNWGELEAELKTRLSRLQSLQYNIVVLCHVNDVFGAEDHEVEPLLKGGMKKSLTREFPYVIGLHRRKEMVLEEGAVQAEPRDVLYAITRPTTLYPMARTPDQAVPTFKVSFSPKDYEFILDCTVEKVASLAAEAVIRPELTQPATNVPPRPAAPPQAAPAAAPSAPKPAPATSTTPAGENSGPVSVAGNAQVDRLAARGAKAKANDAAAEAEQTLDEAVDVAKDVLGGTELSLFDQLKECTGRSQAVLLYKENQAAWTEELTAYMKERSANDPAFAAN